MILFRLVPYAAVLWLALSGTASAQEISPLTDSAGMPYVFQRSVPERFSGEGEFGPVARHYPMFTASTGILGPRPVWWGFAPENDAALLLEGRAELPDIGDPWEGTQFGFGLTASGAYRAEQVDRSMLVFQGFGFLYGETWRIQFGGVWANLLDQEIRAKPPRDDAALVESIQLFLGAGRQQLAWIEVTAVQRVAISSPNHRTRLTPVRLRPAWFDPFNILATDAITGEGASWVEHPVAGLLPRYITVEYANGLSGAGHAWVGRVGWEWRLPIWGKFGRMRADGGLVPPGVHPSVPTLPITEDLIVFWASVQYTLVLDGGPYEEGWMVFAGISYMRF